MEENKLTTVEGVIQAIIYKSDDSGYTVAKALLPDGEEITLVGAMPFLGCGEHISAEGQLVNHPQHGIQFQVQSYLRELPSDAAGIYEYLASKTIKGIGPKTARAIVDRFGDESFDVLATRPELLTQIRGITAARAKEIQSAFLQLGSMRLLLEFLTEHQLPPYFAAGLLKLYGEQATEQLRNNPYLLCSWPFYLDFYRADELAFRFGIMEDSDLRLEAALLYELEYNLQNGHTFIPRDKLIAATSQLCAGDPELLERRLNELIDREQLVEEAVSGITVCYLQHIHRQECFVAEEICRLQSMIMAEPHNLQQMLRSEERHTGITYAEKQKEAICLCFRSALALITGGPGTGKTTALLSAIDLLEDYGLTVLLAAPTGRAAKRMSELCHREAKTLHRALEACFDPNGIMGFRRNRSNPLDADVIIVDEASMLDLQLAASLLEAMKPHTRLVLVGDADQLPPVGAGNFFADLLACDCLPRVRLTDIFRQAQNSDIIVNAHSINGGVMPPLKKNNKDFYFTTTRSADTTVETVVSLVTSRIPNHFGIPAQDIQVICPSRQMACGTVALNRRLQEAVNPPSPEKGEVQSGSAVFRLGDRVMQTRNNYDRVWRKCDSPELGSGVYNGDMGVIVFLDRREGVLIVRFDDREAEYAFEDLVELEHAYAITAHKSQGSEYPAVVIPAFAAPQRLLNRNLLYTAVTRAKQLLVMAGREEVVEQMVAADRKNKRYSALKQRIRRLCDA